MEEIIKIFNKENIRYLLIGGQAMRLFGMPRFSMDWDFYIPGKDIQNISRINKLLSPYLDMDLEPLGEKGQNFIQTFQTPFGILQFHLSPIGLPPFEIAENNAKILTLEDGTPVKTINEKDLYLCKITINRPKDQDDIIFLKNLLDRNESNDRRP